MSVSPAMRRSRPQNDELERYINLKLAALGQPDQPRNRAAVIFWRSPGPLLRNYHQKDLLLGNRLCPADLRIQAFLDAYLEDVSARGRGAAARRHLRPRPPRHGARDVACRRVGDLFASPYLSSYRVPQGVLHNPKQRPPHHPGHLSHRRRRPARSGRQDRRAQASFRRPACRRALRPPADLLRCRSPATRRQQVPAVCVAAAAAGRLSRRPASDPQKTMEIRFFAPAAWSATSISSRASSATRGDPYLPENDAALDVEHWTGHTGCVDSRAAPDRHPQEGPRPAALGRSHRTPAPRRHVLDATRTNPTTTAAPSSSTCRDERGVIVTIIADNYFGYCKKEVKTQISYAANLFGLCEEEHAGGALAFPTYVSGEDFYAGRTCSLKQARL